MESLKARGCCTEKQLESTLENSERIGSYFSTCSKLDSYNWAQEVPEAISPRLWRSGSRMPESFLKGM
jgi:hypothetical protein